MLQRDNGMRVCVLVSLLIISMLFVICSSAVPIHAASSWSIQTVDKNARDSGVIALDSNNNPHITYDQSVTVNRLGENIRTTNVMYASWNGSGWNIQTAFKQAAVDGLVLDSNNNPHILYRNQTGLEPSMYASWTGSTWNIQNGFSGSLALDSTGNPHIAYFAGNAKLMYASWTGSGWSTQTIDFSESFFGSHIFLALDRNNSPHILYGYDISNHGYNGSTTVKYAEWNNATGWVIQTVVSNILEGGFGNIALDSNGCPHFTYFPLPYGNETLSYASWNGSAWYTQIVPLNVSLVVSPGYLALDSHNYPHIVYYNEAPDSFLGALMYASWTGKAWSIQTVDPDNATEVGVLTLDSDGNPHISYLAQPPNAGQPSSIKYLNYATITEPTPTSTATPAPTNEFALLIIVPVFTVIVLATLAYIWKKKTKK